MEHRCFCRAMYPGCNRHYAVLTAISIAIIGILFISSNWSALAPVGSSYWKLPEGYGLYAQHGPGLRTVAFMAYLVFAAVLGTLILTTFLEVEGEALPDTIRWIPLAAFIPGYLAVVAINRVVTFALPNLTAVGLLPLVYFLLTMCLGIASRRLLTKKNASLALEGTVRCSAIFLVVLVLQVQTDNSEHVLGDGLKPFLEMIRNGTGLAPHEYFPALVQHYDETMFLYPFFAPSGMAGEIIELFWLMYSMGKASVLACVIATLLILSRSRMRSYLVALLICIGCLSVFGGKTLLLFDSGNPLRANLHIGRMAIAILPIVFFGLAISGRVIVKRGTIAGLIGAFLVGIGISAISISSIVTLASIFAGMIILTLPTSVKVESVSVFALIALLLIAYTLRGAYGGPWIFLCAVAVAFASIGYFAARSIRARLPHLTTQAFFPVIFVLTLGTVYGLLLLGNVYSYDYLGLLGFPRMHGTISAKSIPEFAIGFNRYCGRFPLVHCTSLWTFFSSFGLALMLASVAVLVNAQSAHQALPTKSDIPNRPPVPDTHNHNASALSKAIACCMLFLVAGFFAYDFTNGAMFGWVPVWFKSRLIEPWYYAVLVFSMLTLLMSERRMIRVFAVLILAWQLFAYAFVLAEAPLHLQFIRNGSFLLHKAIDMYWLDAVSVKPHRWR